MRLLYFTLLCLLGVAQVGAYLFGPGTGGSVTTAQAGNKLYICGDYNGTVNLSPVFYQTVNRFSTTGGIFIVQLNLATGNTWVGTIDGPGLENIRNCYVSPGARPRLYILGTTTSNSLDIDPTTSVSTVTAGTGFVSVLSLQTNTPVFVWGRASNAVYSSVAVTTGGVIFVGQGSNPQNLINTGGLPINIPTSTNPDIFIQKTTADGVNVYAYGIATPGKTNNADIKSVGVNGGNVYFSLNGQGGRFNPATPPTTILPCGSNSNFQVAWRPVNQNQKALKLDWVKELLETTCSSTTDQLRDKPNSAYDGRDVYFAVNYKTTGISLVNDSINYWWTPKFPAPFTSGTAIGITKRSSNGELQWSRAVATGNNGFLRWSAAQNDIDANSCGVVVGGTFKGLVDFSGSVAIPGDMALSAIRNQSNYFGCFVVAYNRNGNIRWVRALKTFFGQCTVTSVSMNQYCEVTVGGYLSGKVSFRECVDRSDRSGRGGRGGRHGGRGGSDSKSGRSSSDDENDDIVTSTGPRAFVFQLSAWGFFKP